MATSANISGSTRGTHEPTKLVNDPAFLPDFHPQRLLRISHQQREPTDAWIPQYGTTSPQQYFHQWSQSPPLRSPSVPKGVSKSTLTTKQSDLRPVCVVCHDPILATPVLLRCGHNYDSDCLSQFVLSAVRDESLFPLRCCGHAIPQHLLQRHLSNDALTQWNEKAQEFKTLKRVYCANISCSRFLGALQEKDPQTLHCPSATCTTCTCNGCRIKVEGEHICQGAQDDEELKALKNMEGWASCPGCDRLVERLEGCSHMSCRCGTQFCYTCSKQLGDCTCRRAVEVWNAFGIVDEMYRDHVRHNNGIPYLPYPLNDNITQALNIVPDYLTGGMALPNMQGPPAIARNVRRRTSHTPYPRTSPTAFASDNIISHRPFFPTAFPGYAPKNHNETRRHTQSQRHHSKQHVGAHHQHHQRHKRRRDSDVFPEPRRDETKFESGTTMSPQFPAMYTPSIPSPSIPPPAYWVEGTMDPVARVGDIAYPTLTSRPQTDDMYHHSEGVPSSDWTSPSSSGSEYFSSQKPPEQEHSLMGLLDFEALSSPSPFLPQAQYLQPFSLKHDWIVRCNQHHWIPMNTHQNRTCRLCGFASISFFTCRDCHIHACQQCENEF